MKDFWVGLFMPRRLGGDDQLEEDIQTGRLHFFGLRFIEAIGNDVNAVFVLEIGEDFFGMREYMRLGRRPMHEILLKLQGNGIMPTPGMGKNPREPLFSQVVFVDFAHIVPIPKLEIDQMERFPKLFESRDTQILELVVLVKLGQGLGHISVIIPKRVIKVEEEMLVGFQREFSVCIGYTGFY